MSTKINEKFQNMKDEEVLAYMSETSLPEAQEYLLVKYKNFVRAKARPYFLAGAEMDDLIQEGMIGLYKAIRDFNPQKQKSFIGFADMCITGQILTALKSAQRQKHRPLNSYISLDGETGDRDGYDVLSVHMKAGEHEPEKMLIRREQKEEMQKCLDKLLSNLEKKVLEKYLNGLSYEAIADVLQMNVKSVNNALQRIRTKTNNIGRNDFL